METLDALLGAIDGVCADCADVQGAVLATAEGLVLAARGTLAGEVPAAAATYLADDLDRHLSLVLSTACSDALVWTPAGLWGLARLPSRHVVLVHAADRCAAGTLRLALARLRRDCAPALEALALPADG